MDSIIKKTGVYIVCVCVGISWFSSPGHADDQAHELTSLLRVSSKNPRYFEDADGNVVLLTGSHTWLNALDGGVGNPPPHFDYTGWLDFLEQYNHNFFRLWTWEQAAWVNSEASKWHIVPTRYLRTGPGTALDGGAKFDITQFNQSYFDRIRQRIIEAGDRGFYVSVMLFNGWSVTSSKSSRPLSDPWEGHPLNLANNVNGIDGDLNNDGKGTEVHELNTLTGLQEAFVKKMIDTVNDLDNVLYEVSNESHSGSAAWQYHMIDIIRSYESNKPKQHPIGMTYIWPGGNNKELYDSSADWISYHGDLDNPVIADGKKVIIADTDHHCGICGTRDWAWKSFTRGENPILMDPYIDVYESIDIDLNDPNNVSLRKSLGYIRAFSLKIDLTQAYPCGALATTLNCLGYITSNQAEFLVYFPTTGKISLDLSKASFELDIEWFNPANGLVRPGGSIMGGSSSQKFLSPWSGDSVLYIHKK